MEKERVYEAAKNAGTFIGKTIVCFASGLMLVADAATRSKRNFTTGNVNVTVSHSSNGQSTQRGTSVADSGAVPAYTTGKKSRFYCRQCGGPVDVKSFRVSKGYVPGKGFLCENCLAQKKATKYYDDEDEAVDEEDCVTAVCAGCGKSLKAKSFRLLRKYRIGNKYYCRDCYREHEDD